MLAISVRGTIAWRFSAWAGLALIGAPGLAFGQLSPADIEDLRKRGEQEGWTFDIGENSATSRSMEELAGALPVENWREGSRTYRGVPNRDLPASFDWRTRGCCTPVKDQGQCGSCWAFATVGVLEQSIRIRDGLSVDLSEQWLVSCNRENWGCWGGSRAHHYFGEAMDVCRETGAVKEADFPYTATKVPCDCPYPHHYFIDGWGYILDPEEVVPTSVLKQAIMDYGPVCVHVHSNTAMHAYNGGVFNACSSELVNHAVVLVGWDDNQGDGGVWIMRNSWGRGWGEAGYMRIEYGCSSIGMWASYIEYSTQLRPPETAPNPHNSRKHRYISFSGFESDLPVALLVYLTDGPGPAGSLGWVGEPEELYPEGHVARIVNTPVYRDWTERVIHVGDCEIVPAATYAVHSTFNGLALSEPFVVGTIEKPEPHDYGDVVGAGLGTLPPCQGFLPPDGFVSVTDVQAYVLTAEGPTSPSAYITWIDIHGLGPGSPPNQILNASDLQQILLGLAGVQFSDGPDHLNPADCP
ncbi:MAG: hypothetical protein JSU63_10420 [Phycisphaerales bacterium]|nr:MAG: hypothetical protein JSU63_10420 [Phycisphaerales bacterium]